MSSEEKEKRAGTPAPKLEEISLELDVREIGKGTLGIIFPKYVRDKLSIKEGQKLIILRKSDEIWFKLERGK